MIEIARKSNDKVLNSGIEEPGWDTVARTNEQGYIQPSGFIPFCSFGAKLIGRVYASVTKRFLSELKSYRNS